MRHRLLEFDDAKKLLARTRQPRAVPAESAQFMAAMVKAASREDILRALHGLGASLGPESIPSFDLSESPLYRTIRRFVVVVIGPEAEPYWRGRDAEELGSGNPYASLLADFALKLHCTAHVSTNMPRSSHLAVLPTRHRGLHAGAGAEPIEQPLAA